MLLVPKNDGGGGQACYQSEGIKFIHLQFSLQNGRFASVKGSSEREREREGERESNFMSKVDLKDVYFCVPLYRNHQTFLRFQ